MQHLLWKDINALQTVRLIKVPGLIQRYLLLPPIFMQKDHMRLRPIGKLCHQRCLWTDIFWQDLIPAKEGIEQGSLPRTELPGHDDLSAE